MVSDFMNIVFREGLSYDECHSLTKLYLMADEAHGSSDTVLAVKASDLLRLAKALMRDHAIDYDRKM